MLLPVKKCNLMQSQNCLAFGGQENRTLAKVFMDVVRGKLGEEGWYTFSKKYYPDASLPCYDIFQKHHGDDGSDSEIKEKLVDVKNTKPWGSYLAFDLARGRRCARLNKLPTHFVLIKSASETETDWLEQIHGAGGVLESLINRQEAPYIAKQKTQIQEILTHSSNQIEELEKLRNHKFEFCVDFTLIMNELSKLIQSARLRYQLAGWYKLTEAVDLNLLRTLPDGNLDRQTLSLLAISPAEFQQQGSQGVLGRAIADNIVLHERHLKTNWNDFFI